MGYSKNDPTTPSRLEADTSKRLDWRGDAGWAAKAGEEGEWGFRGMVGSGGGPEEIMIQVGRSDEAAGGVACSSVALQEICQLVTF